MEYNKTSSSAPILREVLGDDHVIVLIIETVRRWMVDRVELAVFITKNCNVSVVAARRPNAPASATATYVETFQRHMTNRLIASSRS